MYVLPSHRLVFLAQPRTASRAISKLILHMGGSGPHPRHHALNLELLEDLRGQGFRPFSVVRNHWDAVVSWFFINAGHVGGYRSSHEEKRKRFPRFLDHWLEKNEYIRRPGGVWTQGVNLSPAKANASPALYWIHAPASDLILRYENLQEEIGKLLGRGRELWPIQRSPRHADYRDYYTPTTRDLVMTTFWDEIEEYGYEY